MSISDKLITIADDIPRVYDAGRTGIYGDFYDIIWNSVQDKGKRTNYSNAFTSNIWNDFTFSPKYPIRPTGSAALMFCANDAITNIPCYSWTDSTFTLFNLSSVTNAASMFYACYSIKTIEAPLLLIGVNADNGYNSTFAHCKALRTILHLTLNSEYSGNYDHIFYNCGSLENITIAGSITSSISFTTNNKLSVESMKSIIYSLKNYIVDDDQWLAHTISFTEDCWDRLEADSTSPTGGTWRDYVEDELGWLT